MTEVLEKPKLVTVFGGSGFLGRYVVRALVKRGYYVRAAVRRPELAGHLQPVANMGQVHAIQANLRVGWSIDRAVQGADHVINLVGILSETRRQTFSAVHESGSRGVAEAARAVGAGLTQISAIGADEESESAYARSKARAERAVRDVVPEAVIMRPSVLFGPEDEFFNRFASMARFSPILPLIGGGHTRLQPVFVGDVAEAIARAVDGDADPGQTYELGGPTVMTLREIMEETLETIDRKRLLLPVPWWLASLQAAVLGLLPNPLLTTDQVIQLRNDNVVSQAALASGRTLEGLGISPQSTAVVLATYLWRYRVGGQFAPKAPA